MSSESTTLDEISRAAFSLLLEEPFYAHVLAGMPREVSDGVRTTGAAWDGQQVRLRVNPEFFLNELTSAQRVGVLKHEILHVAFRHIFRGADRDPELYGIAADVVVNQYVKPHAVPDGYPTLADFPDLGLAPNMTVDEYYASLASLLRQLREQGYGKTHFGGGDGSEFGQQKRASGRSGKAAPMPDWAKSTNSPRSAVSLMRFLTGGTVRGDDRGWRDGNDGLTVATRYAVGNLVVRARDRLLPHQWADLPAALVAEFEQILAQRQPRVDWKRLVRIFCASSGRTRIRHTTQRISRRYGTRPGIKVQRLQRLLVAVDTSGSIDSEILGEFFAVIHNAWRVGASVVVVECDAAVQRSYDYRGAPPQAIEGGGGTAFEPVFQWMRTQKAFDGMLYLTDGYGPVPSSRPPCRLLWVIPASGAQASLPFGPTVRIPIAKE